MRRSPPAVGTRAPTRFRPNGAPQSHPPATPWGPVYGLKTGESYSRPDLVEAAIQVPKSVSVLLIALKARELGVSRVMQPYL